MGCTCFCNPFYWLRNSAHARQEKGKTSKKGNTKWQGGSARWDTGRDGNPVLATPPKMTATVIWGLPNPPPGRPEMLIYPPSHALEVAQTKEASLPELVAENEIPSSISYDEMNGSSDYSYVSSPPRQLCSRRRDFMYTTTDLYQHTPARGATYHSPDHNESLTTLFSDENPNACSVS